MSADNDLLLDNAAVCSQHPALEDSTVRECITLNVISPLRRELAILREQLAERDAEIGTLQAVIADLRAALAGVKGSYSALREHADRLAYVLGEGNAVNAYRADFPEK